MSDNVVVRLISLFTMDFHKTSAFQWTLGPLSQHLSAFWLTLPCYSCWRNMWTAPKCVRSGIHFWWPSLSPVSQAKSQRQHSSTVILSPSSKEELIKLATRTVWSEGRDCDGKSHFCNNFAINPLQCCNAMSTLPSSDCSNPLNKVWCCQRERSKHWSYFTRRKNIQ